MIDKSRFRIVRSEYGRWLVEELDGLWPAPLTVNGILLGSEGGLGDLMFSTEGKMWVTIQRKRHSPTSAPFDRRGDRLVLAGCHTLLLGDPFIDLLLQHVERQGA